MRRSFDKAAETREQKRTRLEKQAKELAESLRRPSTPQPRLTPDGKLRQDGIDAGRQAVEQQRVDIDKQLAKIKAELDERRAKDKEFEKSRERDMGRSL